MYGDTSLFSAPVSTLPSNDRRPLALSPQRGSIFFSQVHSSREPSGFPPPEGTPSPLHSSPPAPPSLNPAPPPHPSYPKAPPNYHPPSANNPKSLRTPRLAIEHGRLYRASIARIILPAPPTSPHHPPRPNPPSPPPSPSPTPPPPPLPPPPSTQFPETKSALIIPLGALPTHFPHRQKNLLTGQPSIPAKPPYPNTSQMSAPTTLTHISTPYLRPNTSLNWITSPGPPHHNLNTPTLNIRPLPPSTTSCPPPPHHLSRSHLYFAPPGAQSAASNR